MTRDTGVSASDALLELAERCEQATGPDRELDWAIINAVNPDARWAYTGAIDAAVTLVPERWAWLVEYVGVDPYPPCTADLWVPTQREDGSNFPRCRVGAATPALALCAAALKARAHD